MRWYLTQNNCKTKWSFITQGFYDLIPSWITLWYHCQIILWPEHCDSEIQNAPGVSLHDRGFSTLEGINRELNTNVIPIVCNSYSWKMRFINNHFESTDVSGSYIDSLIECLIPGFFYGFLCPADITASAGGTSSSCPFCHWWFVLKAIKQRKRCWEVIETFMLQIIFPPS